MIMKRRLFYSIIIILIVCGIVCIFPSPSLTQYPTYLNIYPYYNSPSSYQPYQNMPYQTIIFYRQTLPSGLDTTPYNSYPFNLYNPYTGYPSSLTRGPFSMFPSYTLFYFRPLPDSLSSFF